MSSLPTSLIIVGLVVAWLVVLVPMVAKRRDEVPENDEESGSFRVLRRDDAAQARPAPVLSRTVRARGDEGDAPQSVDDDGEVPQSADDARGGEVAAELRESSRDDRAVAVGMAHDDDAVGVGDDVGSGERASARRVASADDVTDSDEGEPTTYDAVPGAAATVGESWRDPSRGAWIDLGQTTDAESYSRTGHLDPHRHRPVPVRPGRGGYNVEAAAATKRDRYRQRRRVALALLALTGLGGALGAFGLGVGWVVMVVVGTLMVLYFAYLRRQVRVEAEISSRRAARLAQSPGRRSGARMSVAEQVWQHRTGHAPGPGDDVNGEFRVASHARPSVPMPAQLPGEFVELDDNDPAFEDLEYRRPQVYRRRAS